MQAMAVSVRLKATDGISPVISKVNAKLANFEHRTTQLGKSAGKFGAIGMAGAISLGSMFVKPVKSAIAFESAMADVKKVVNFTPNTNEFKAFSAEILNLSTKIPLAASELATIAASGGQLGIAKDKIIGFTAVVAKMSTAFDMMPSQAGDSIAKLMNIYGLSIEQASSLGDAVNYLSDNTAAKASDIVNILARTGGMAKSFGINAVQVTALGDAFLSMGMAPEVASTSINAMLTKLSAADKQGKRFQSGLKAIGMSAKSMQNMIAKDANGAIMTVLDKLKHLDKQKQTGVLLDLFGMEYASKIALVVNGLHNYKKALDLVKNGDAYDGSMEREFQVRSVTTENQLKLLNNSISRVGITMGSILLPPLNKAVDKIKAVTDKIAQWTEKNPELTNSIMKWGAVLIGSLAGVSALSLGFSALMFAFRPVIGIFKAGAWALSKLGLRSAGTATAIKSVETALEGVAGKSFMARMGVQMPKKASLLTRFGAVLSSLRAFAVANPILIAASVAAMGAGAMASTQHQQLMDNRPSLSTTSEKKLQERIKRREERIAAMKGEGSLGGRASQFLLHGNATKSEIRQQEKLLALDKKRLALKQPVVKPVSANVPTVKAHVATKDEIAQMRAEALAKAYKIRDSRQKAQSEVKKPIVKKVQQNKNIHVEAPIQITVNAVNGKAPTKEIGSMVQNHVKKAVKASSSTSYEDQE